MFNGVSKQDFVCAMLADADIAGHFINPKPEQIYHLVWYNPLNPKSYRITQFAFSILSKKFAVYSYQFDESINNRLLLNLEKYFKFPYYIHGRRQVSIFSDNHAVFIELLGGNVLDYLTRLSEQ